ncbi:MAG: gliding motility-associated C-terminal domain-containing protein [Lewinellaceae bacterium]|nr:gliding motility-associated C-terminal domain-containing protein [Lewinellaceae bacterium]
MIDIENKPTAVARFVLTAIGLWGVAMLSAQPTCTGNLGANIFDAGDFGSGTTNLILSDPGIAPGYIYTLSPPPQDGFYTITNNTGAWSGLFGTWLQIRDNSSDPLGYMMVVNASYSTGIFYEQTVDGLCENTLYEFSADVINLIRSGVANHIKPNVSFLINDEVRYSTGDIPQNNIWNAYGFTFTTAPGETSVKLTLRNNAPGGIGNDLALDNISFRACGPAALILPVEVANICEDGNPIALNATIQGDQFPTPALQWQESFDEGATWADIPGANGNSIQHTQLSGGFYYYRYLLANSPANLANSKCRVISNVKVVYVQPKFHSVLDTICEGGTYLFGDTPIVERGTYIDTLVSSIGCDSIVTLMLSVVPDGGLTAEMAASDPSCAGYQDGAIEVSDVRNFYPPVSISLDGEVIMAEQASFSNLAAGSYFLSVYDRLGCRVEYDVVLNNPDSLRIGLGPDRAIGLGDEIILPVTTNYPLSSFEWSPPELVICNDDCLKPFLQPLQTTTYYFTGITASGCTATDSVRIQVNEVRSVYIPNAFSPNEDGRNDRFVLYADVPNVQEVASMQIFNRWGAVVFEQSNFLPNDLSLGWDGTFKGKEAPAGAYTYVFRVRFLDEVELEYTGAVHLVR